MYKIKNKKIEQLRHIVISDYASPNVLQSAAIECGQP